MLEEDLKRILRERRWLFRGTTEAAFEQRHGLYYATHTSAGVTTSGTLSVLYAMVYAINEGEKRESRPMLLALDARPYVDNIEKGLEWKPFYISEGIVTKDEYEIRTPIRLRHVRRIETVADLRKYVGPTTRDAFRRLRGKFAELQE